MIFLWTRASLLDCKTLSIVFDRYSQIPFLSVGLKQFPPPIFLKTRLDPNAWSQSKGDFEWMVFPWVFFSLESEVVDEEEECFSPTISGLIGVGGKTVFWSFGLGPVSLDPVPWVPVFGLKPLLASFSLMGECQATTPLLGSPPTCGPEVSASRPSVTDRPVRDSDFCTLCHFDQLNFKGWFLQKMLKAALRWVTS